MSRPAERVVNARETHLIAREQAAPFVPARLVHKVYQIEETVQFDKDRRVAKQAIQTLIQEVLDSEIPMELRDGDAA